VSLSHIAESMTSYVARKVSDFDDARSKIMTEAGSLHQRRLPHAWGADDSDEPRWRLVWNSVDERYMEALFPYLTARVSR